MSVSPLNRYVGPWPDHTPEQLQSFRRLQLALGQPLAWMARDLTCDGVAVVYFTNHGVRTHTNIDAAGEFVASFAEGRERVPAPWLNGQLTIGG